MLSEEKQAEFDAFAAYYALIAAKPYTSASRSLLNQLRTIAVGQYGNGAWQQLVRGNRRQPAEQPERVVKMSGGIRRNAPPQKENAPQPGTPRWERLKAAGLLESKSAVQSPVAGVENAKNERRRTRKEIIEQVSTDHKKEIEAQIQEQETHIVHLSTGAEFDTETGRTVNDLLADAAIKGDGEFSAKDLLEKYGDGARDLIFEKLVEMGHDADVLGEKSDRQLANLLKKEASK